MNPEAIAAARVVVNDSLSIKQGETVLISSDTRNTVDLSFLMAAAVRDTGAVPVEMFMPKLAHPGAPIPALVTKAAESADVWIELNEIYILGTEADHGARTAGLRRFYSLSGMTIDDLIMLELKVDRPALAELGHRLAELTTGREELLITCRNGSDVRGSIRDRIALPDTTTMPLGQTHITPVEDSVAGRLVFDGTAFPPESIGVLSGTIVVEFADGSSRVVGDGRESEVFTQWQAWTNDPDIYRLCHISYGYHPNVPLPTGRLVADERVFGCLCVGFGPPQPYKCHTDLTILEATVEVDGELIQDSGRFVDPRIQELSRHLNAPGY